MSVIFLMIVRFVVIICWRPETLHPV